VGTGSDAAVDRGGEELVEFVDGFEIEAGGLVIAHQNPCFSKARVTHDSAPLFLSRRQKFGETD
jgi:hypothetical protein